MHACEILIIRVRIDFQIEEQKTHGLRFARFSFSGEIWRGQAPTQVFLGEKLADRAIRMLDGRPSLAPIAYPAKYIDGETFP